MNIWIEHNQNLIDFISKLMTILAVGFAAIQASLLKRDFEVKNRRASIEKAVELSKFYADEILNDIAYIFYVYKMTNLDQICNRIDSELIHLFDIQELSDLLSKKDIDEYNNKFKSIQPELLIVAYSNIYSIEQGLSFNIFEEYQSANPNAKRQIANKMTVNFNNIKGRLMNNLEYFAMSFNDGVADEATVYQSLHQSFIKIAKLLYIDIATINKSECDKYYTHLIDMFNRWHSIYLENYREECLKESELRDRINELKSNKTEISKRRKRR